MIASMLGKNTIIKQLLTLDAHINATDANGITPLMRACMQGRTKTVRLLLDHPRCRYDIQDFQGNTALIFAAAEGMEEIVVQMIRKDVNPHIMNQENKSAIQVALERGYLRIAQILKNAMQ